MHTYMKIRLVHSPAGRIPRQHATVKGLGLRHLQQERVIEDTAATRGMVGRVSHLVCVVEEGIKERGR